MSERRERTIRYGLSDGGACYCVPESRPARLRYAIRAGGAHRCPATNIAVNALHEVMVHR
jgi:hypothetical protein